MFKLCVCIKWYQKNKLSLNLLEIIVILKDPNWDGSLIYSYTFIIYLYIIWVWVWIINTIFVEKMSSLTIENII